MYQLSWILIVSFAVTTLLQSSVSGRGLGFGMSTAGLFSVGGRVIGGRDAKAGEFPYQLQLRFLDQLICGATLVEDPATKKQFVITAGHCVTWPGSTIPFIPLMVSLRAGTLAAEDEGEKRIVKWITLHEGYEFTAEGVPLNDIAVLHLFEDFTISDNIKPLTLPEKDKPTQDKIILSGWGRTSTASNDAAITLQTVELPVVDSTTCNNWYSDGQDIKLVYETMFCAGTEKAEIAACNGDSGGPAAGIDGDKLYLAGVVSWGANGCSKFPTVFTQVSSFTDWISKAIQ